MAVFHDHFSGHAGDYSRWRPGYPTELFDWLASLTERSRAWDCATGNGQAAGGLTPFFEHVVATDASVRQLARAVRHDGVSYHCAEATRSALRPASVDLVTVAQALHWFDIPAFVAEARRVGRSGGALVAWTYDLFRVDEAVDRAVTEFVDGTVGAYWPPEREYVDTRYAGLDLGLEPIAAPRFRMRERWNLEQVLAYISTWSAVPRYRDAHGSDPLPRLAAALEPIWQPAAQRRPIRWNLTVLAGRL